MAKDNTIILALIAIVVLVVLGMFVQKNYPLFIITGAETMSRVVPNNAAPGSILSVTYTVSGASGNWGATVLDNLSCPGSPMQTNQFVILSSEGNSKVITYQLPNQNVACTLSGNYQFGTKSINTFPSSNIQVGNLITCTSGADTNHDGKVDMSELGNYITAWISGQKTRTQIGNSIMEWSNGCQ